MNKKGSAPPEGRGKLLKTAGMLLIPAAAGVWNLLALLEGGLSGGGYIRVAVTTAVSLLIIFSVNTEYIAKLDRYDLDGATLNHIRILTNLVTLLAVFPLFKLAMPLLRLVLDSLLADGFSQSEWKAIEDFLARPAVEMTVIGAVYLICLWKLVVHRLTANPFRKGGGKKGRTAPGPDGGSYGLPDSYQTAVTYLLGSDSDIYDDAFQNQVHRLMWATEGLEQAHRLMEDYWPKWEFSNAGAERFAEDTWIGRGVRWSQFGKLARMAIDGWRHWKDEERALRYSRWVADAGFLMGEKGSYPVFGFGTAEVEECCRDLVDAYRKGRGSVKPDLSQALEIQNRLERLRKDWQTISKKANDMYEEHLEFMRQMNAGSAAAGSAATADSGSEDGGAGGGSDLDRLPARMSDGSRNTYVRTTGAGAYPVAYSCYETGDTIYIYRAVLHGGFAETDCGSFYY